ncbi:MAG TPA: hypothetical protein VF444_10660 [Pseudonocardiaceae bacterium]
MRVRFAVFLEIPGANAELEITPGGVHSAPLPHPESLIVLCLADQAEVDAIGMRIGQPPVRPANPYWRKNVVAFEDPDGFQVLFTVNPHGRDMGGLAAAG